MLRELLLPSLTGGRRGKAVEAALREAIRSGRLAAGTRLPSSRDLAAQLGLSRGTVTTLYGQLVAEGYLLARHGSGTEVAPLGDDSAPRPAPPAARPRWRYDLKPGLPALSAFPRAEWLAAQRESLTTMPDAELGYPDPAGHPALRAELASYLGRVRALPTTPDDIVITNGAAEGLSLLAGVLRAEGHTTVAVEDPSHVGQAELLAAHGLQPHGVPVDDDGIDITLLTAPCRAVVVSAAHQFPLGVALGPDRRRSLLSWARATGSLVIEDDYDAEHRYDRAALGAVRALDPERVAYVGSVSKVLAPALRIGWLVLPTRLREQVIELKFRHDLGCAPMPQAALAVLLRGGGYDRHLRRTRRLYRQRRDALLGALAEHLPAWRPFGIAAGLHVVVRLPDGTDDASLQRKLAAAGVNAPALSGYAHTPDSPFPGLVLGYAALTPDRLREAVTVTAQVANQGLNPR
ncbi:PLP-dependent aminotransferase family protein [Amycolatopsis suaedae]|uniref:PLP-dependent aminotransferase family protein n=1 Tax=Amycolatopsis suaedae TaxID=2510978 RepID=A0A4Q7J7B8_9PSEU|nr:PLP-dependent aminotransferase family protein [Amycolatopsis suaedae]RZQ63561.1 PLP-dependent aminotransferase family protein [Amycolatopsis suaedae]